MYVENCNIYRIPLYNIEEYVFYCVLVFEEKLSNTDANNLLNFKRFDSETMENVFRHSRNNSRTIQLEYR